MKTTLLDLVSTVSLACEDDETVVRVVQALVNGGRARLCGSFRGTLAIGDDYRAAAPRRRRAGAEAAQASSNWAA